MLAVLSQFCLCIVYVCRRIVRVTRSVRAAWTSAACAPLRLWRPSVPRSPRPPRNSPGARAHGAGRGWEEAKKCERAHVSVPGLPAEAIKYINIYHPAHQCTNFIIIHVHMVSNVVNFMPVVSAVIYKSAWKWKARMSTIFQLNMSLSKSRRNTNVPLPVLTHDWQNKCKVLARDHNLKIII